MERVIVVDTETTGLFQKNRPAPRLVEIGWEIITPKGAVIERYSAVVKPDGFSIEKTEGFPIHMISDEVASHGTECSLVMSRFLEALEKCTLFVAHNVSYDRRILKSELVRLGYDTSPLENIKTYCTMEEGSKLMAQNYKWPKLQELFFRLFEEEMKSRHRVAPDVEAARKCFVRMKDYT